MILVSLTLSEGISTGPTGALSFSGCCNFIPIIHRLFRLDDCTGHTIYKGQDFVVPVNTSWTHYAPLP